METILSCFTVREIYYSPIEGVTFHCDCKEQDNYYEGATMTHNVPPEHVRSWSIITKNEESTRGYIGLKGITSPLNVPLYNDIDRKNFSDIMTTIRSRSDLSFSFKYV